MHVTTSAPARMEPATASRRLTMLFAAACGLIVANIYYAQPLAGPIAAAIGLPAAAAGVIVTMTQIGYGAGLLLVVPLGDLLENRRLIATVIAAAALALAVAGTATNAAVFLVAALFIGLGSVAVQILVPLAAHLAPEETRGRVVGNVMSGLMLGIMLARPIASVVADHSTWRTVFACSAAMMLLVAAVLMRMLPLRRPAPGLRYGVLLQSMGRLAMTTPVLQRRAGYHACLFAAFSLFWTTVPLYLSGPAFQLSQSGIALFAFVGVAGTIAAPLAGRWADKGWSRTATGFALSATALAFLIMQIGPPGSPATIVLLAAAGFVLDVGISANVVLGQRAIFALRAEQRSRLNGLYMAAFFFAGAIGSALGAWAYHQYGWHVTAWIGLVLPCIALAAYSGEFRSTASG